MRRDPGRVLDALAAMGADLVCLQEADLRLRGRAAIFDANEVTARTGLVPVVLGGPDAGLGWRGNVLLTGSRVEVTDVAIFALRGVEPRGGIRADLSVAGHPLRLVTAHLALGPRARLRQAARLWAAAEPERGVATLAMGDFNVWRRDAGAMGRLSQEMDMAHTGPTFPTWRPLVALDRIYHAGPMRLTGAGVWRRDGAALASDHLPVWAAFQLDTRPSPA